MVFKNIRGPQNMVFKIISLLIDLLTRRHVFPLTVPPFHFKEGVEYQYLQWTYFDCYKLATGKKYPNFILQTITVQKG